MFKLLNVYNKNNIITEVTHNGKKVEFNISSIINKRNKDELDPDKQFLLLEKYIDYKGKAFKDKLMNLYVAADDKLMMTITKSEIYPLPINIVHPILDLMNFDDVYNWVKNIEKVPAISKLADKFDDGIERDGLGTKAQTYIKDDYLELVALTLVIKTVLGPIGQFGYLKNSEISGMHKEYILYNFISGHPVGDVSPVHKLFGFAEKLVEISLKDADVSAIRVIEKRIPREETTLYMLSIIMLQKIPIATIVDDNNAKNIITRVYNYINNKLSIKGDVSNAIRNKQAMLDADTNDGEKESIMEAYRIMSELPKGLEVELDWSVSDVNVIVNQLPIPIDGKVLNDASKFTTKFLDGVISGEQMNLLGFIFKDIIDPRGLPYLRIESVVNLLTVGYAYLWALECKYMAILLTSIPSGNDSDSISINITVNRNRITKEVRDELQRLYPYNRVVNAETTTNLVEETIGKLSNNIYSRGWTPTAMTTYVDSVENGDLVSLQPDIKLKLAEMIISLENTRNDYATNKPDERN